MLLLLLLRGGRVLRRLTTRDGDSLGMLVLRMVFLGVDFLVLF